MNEARQGARTVWASRLLCVIGWYFSLFGVGALALFSMSRAGDGTQVMVSQRMFALSVALTVAYIHVAWSLRAGSRWARLVAFPMAIAPFALDGIAAVIGVVAFVLLIRAWSERHNDA